LHTRIPISDYRTIPSMTYRQLSSKAYFF